ncbi:ATP synthase subunit b, mitochondrial-like [Gigantopelta aegis]|uniref:ATP synthase subunit b, mitochondrial-like n=1 Tax=Gigantopelta aegis TaxID=1735272 RepID=UPI001B889381|nr:ATP synthase subunit b, mitochondrial-like [Gigantopelta aegis]
MLSAIALRSGAFSTVVRPQTTQRILAVIQCRHKSDAVKQIENWDKANNIFYGPERDMKNFPHPVMPEHSGKVRLGFIPDEWFQFFYPKTGVTGPYLFTTGLVAYLFSKEIWVVDTHFSEVIGFYLALWMLTKKLGPMFGKSFDETNEKIKQTDFMKPIESAKDMYKQEIKDAEKEIWQQEGQKYIFQAKKENVDLQLESLYRQRLQTVYTDVKKRLDYQLELQSVKRSFEQDHMVRWIVNNVIKGITPQQEKESISKCIGNLKQMASA